jgi:hypothetical protein
MTKNDQKLAFFEKNGSAKGSNTSRGGQVPKSAQKWSKKGQKWSKMALFGTFSCFFVFFRVFFWSLEGFSRKMCKKVQKMVKKRCKNGAKMSKKTRVILQEEPQKTPFFCTFFANISGEPL